MLADYCWVVTRNSPGLVYKQLVKTVHLINASQSVNSVMDIVCKAGIM